MAGSTIVRKIIRRTYLGSEFLDFLCGNLCVKIFQNLLKFILMEKMGKIENQQFQKVTYYQEVRKLKGLDS